MELPVNFTMVDTSCFFIFCPSPAILLLPFTLFLLGCLELGPTLFSSPPLHAPLIVPYVYVELTPMVVDHLHCCSSITPPLPPYWLLLQEDTPIRRRCPAPPPSSLVVVCLHPFTKCANMKREIEQEEQDGWRRWSKAKDEVFIKLSLVRFFVVVSSF